jgi:hypothetical protein
MKVAAIKLAALHQYYYATNIHSQRTLLSTVLRNKTVRNQLAVKATENVIRNFTTAGIGSVRRPNCSQVTNP